MNMELLLLFLSLATITTLLFTLLFAIGVIWRVEMELDASYKFFGWALFFLIVSEIVALVPNREYVVLASFISKLIAALFFFVGVYLMRDIIRKIDGEKKVSSEKEKVL